MANGFSFEDADQVFAGPCVTFEDDRFGRGEERLITLSLLAGHLVAMAHSPPGYSAIDQDAAFAAAQVEGRTSRSIVRASLSCATSRS